MSYDLNFWKEKPGVSPEPESVYRRLCRGEAPDELEDLPSDEIVRELKVAFPKFNPYDEFPLIELDEGSIEVSRGGKCFRFDFRGETDHERNQIVAIMQHFDCPVYDPQVNKRFSLGEAPKYEPLSPQAKKMHADMMEAIMSGKNVNEALANLQKVTGAQRKRGCGSAAVLLMVSMLSTIAFVAVALKELQTE